MLAHMVAFALKLLPFNRHPLSANEYIFVC
jgi:hypothetical protein